MSETEKKINQAAFENLTRQKNDLAERVIRLEDVNAVLREKLEEAEKALKFYADGDHWNKQRSGPADYNIIDKDDLGIGLFIISQSMNVDDSRVGGRTAREYFEKYGEKK